MWVCKHGYETFLIWSIPPSTFMTIFLFTSLYVKRSAIWCLHKFSRFPHSHAQHAYLVKKYFRLNITLGCCWLLTIHVLGLSFFGQKTWVGGIDATFSTLVFIMSSMTLFLMKPLLFNSKMCNCCCQPSHQPINATPFETFCFNIQPMFQCPMIRFYWCLSVLVWMWDSSKSNHSQI